MTDKIDFNDRMLSLGLARVSEAAAIASADLIGRGDEKAADQAAVNAMRDQLNKLDISGVVVIGEGERDEAPMLYIGEEVGSGHVLCCQGCAFKWIKCYIDPGAIPAPNFFADI